MFLHFWLNYKFVRMLLCLLYLRQQYEDMLEGPRGYWNGHSVEIEQTQSYSANQVPTTMKQSTPHQ